MKNSINVIPVMGASGSRVVIPPISVAANTTLAVIGAVKLPQGVSYVDAIVTGYDATGKDGAAYRLSAVAKNIPSRAAKATGTLTSSGNFTDTQTVTIGSKVYTFQTTLTNVDGNVLIGADRTASHANLKAAINLEAGAGTTYAAAMTIHPTVTATSANATTTVVKAKSAGTAGNSIASTETQSNASWGGATLSGGLDASVLIGSVNADSTNEDDSGWTATMAVNVSENSIELKVTSDGSNATEFSAAISLFAHGS